MRLGFELPVEIATEQLEQAVLADETAKDGVFVWEAGYGVDARTRLATMAQRTTRGRFGTILTALP